MLRSTRGRRFGKPKPPRPLRRFTFRVLRLMLVLVLLYLAVSRLLVDTVETTSVSMEPQLTSGDRVVTTPLIFGAYLPAFDRRVPSFRPPRRGDVVMVLPPFAERLGVFPRTGRALLDIPLGRRSRNPIDRGPTWAGPSIRRVIAVPGDTVRMDDYTFYVRSAESEPFVNEFELSRRSYEVRIQELPRDWRRNDPFAGDMEPVELDEGEYFVAGDNRGRALDSRDYGVIRESDIRSLVLLRYWPLSGFGRLGS